MKLYEINMSEVEAGHFEKARTHAGKANSLIPVLSDSVDDDDDFNSWFLAPSWELIPADCPTIQPDPTL